MVSRDRFRKISLFSALVLISIIASSMFFANLSSAYSPIPANIVNLSTKSLQIQVPAVSTPALPTYASLDKWTTTSNTYNKIDAVSTSGSQTIQSKVNNDHQTFNFEKINFPSETVIEKIDLVATAKKGGTQTTKMALTFAKGTTLSDLPLGGTPMTTSFVDYTRDVTNHPGTTTKISLVEINTWQVGGTGVPITFGVAQNTDGKTVLVDKAVLKIRFIDNTKPTTTAGTCGTDGNDPWCRGDLSVTLTASDPQPGAGVDKIYYNLDEQGYVSTTDNPKSIPITTTGIHTVKYYAVDKVGNTEAEKTVTEYLDVDYPVSTAQINDAAPTGGTYAPGAVVTLSCTDQALGSGPDKIFYNLNGGGETEYTTGIVISNPGPNTILYHCVDVAGNVEANNPLTVTIQAATVTITAPPDPAAKKWKDIFEISGETTFTIDTDKVSVDWGDGTTADEWDIDDDIGTWTATHKYGPGTASATPKTITATVVNGGTAVSGSDTKDVTIEKRDTSIGLNQILSTIENGVVYVNGNLRDEDGTGVLPGRTISFTAPPLVTLETASTGEIKVVDGSGLSQGGCGAGTNNSIVLHQDSEITLPGNPTTLDIVFCDSPATFELSKTAGGVTSSISVDLNSSNPPPISDSSGISKITIGNLAGGTVEIYTLSGRNAIDQILFNTGFSGISLEDDGSLIINDGVFSTKGPGPASSGQDYQISAKFDQPDNDYNTPSNTATGSFNVVYNPGSGIGNDVNLIADLGDVITMKPCDNDNPPNAANDDTDVDGICDSFETGGIPYTCGNPSTTCYLALSGASVGVKDIYVDVDGFANHVNADAINDVVAKYNTGHNLNLHVTSSDTSIPEVTPITVWRDTDSSRTNDYDSYKADYFGDAAERATFTGTQSNTYTSTSAIFSGISITTPADAANGNAVHGTITLKMQIKLSAAPSAISQSSASCTGDDSALGINDADITSSINPGATSTQKILTTKIKFKSTGLVTNGSIGTCTVNLAITGAVLNAAPLNENVSPVIYTEKQLAKLNAYRHILYVHSMGGPSGRSEIRGNDAVIALGAYDAVGGHNVGSRDQQAGTFMHELGHLLNLDHGGPKWLMPAGVALNPAVLEQSGINCKPNYPSVMSYSRQLPTSFLNNAAGGGAGGWSLDYSLGTLSSLDEVNLVEANGLVGPAGFSPRIVWGIASSPYYKGGNVVTQSGSPGVSWNGDADTSDSFIGAAQRRDINNFRIFGCQATTTGTSILSDANDWANLDLRLAGSAYFGDGASVDELNEQQLKQIELASSNYIIIPPPAIDGQEIRNAGSQLPIKIDLQNLSGVDITYATIWAEYYLTDPEVRTFIGTGTYSNVAGHYAIPWKTPKNPTGEYHIDVYIVDPTGNGTPNRDSDKHLVGSLIYNGNPITIQVTLN